MTERKPGDWPFINIERQAKEMADAVGSAIDKIREEAYKRGYSDALGESQPTQPQVTEEHVGRLVMVRDHPDEEWIGPVVLKNVYSLTFGAGNFRESQWWQAKLYTGPTRPNWIDHDGRGVPGEVIEAGRVLCQMKDGAIMVVPHYSMNWKHEDGANDIMRYTIIEP